MASQNTSAPTSGSGTTGGSDDEEKNPAFDTGRVADYTKNGAIGIGNWISNTLFPSTNTPSPNSSPSGQDNTDFYKGLNDQRNGYQFTPAPQMVEGGPGGPGITTVDPYDRDAQRRALMLQEQAANGTTPSAAEQLYRKGMDEAAASQLGFAASTQGGNPGQAQRAGLAAGQGIYAKTAADAAALRANEMATARHDFGATSTAARGQTQDLAKANEEAQQRQLAIENQFYLGLTDAQQRAQQAALDAEKQKTQNDINAKAGNQATLGKLFGTAGTLMGS